MKRIGIVGIDHMMPCPSCRNYFYVVRALGAEPVLLDKEADLEKVPGLEGAVIMGGADVEPCLYGEENLACGRQNPELDGLELKAIDRLVQEKKPILGICRGHQILNVYFGGSLIQDLENRDRHIQHEGKDSAHETRLEKGSFLEEIYGTEEISVNSAHHQAVKTLGHGLIPQQYSADGVLEAMRHESLPILGVQWHPERMSLTNRREDTVDGVPLFQYFLKMCK